MKRLFLLLAACALLVGAIGAAPVQAAGEGAVYINVFEDTNHGGASKKFTLNGSGSVPDLFQVLFNEGPLFCNGQPLGDTWNDCISSIIPNFNNNGCVQLWTGTNYGGTLIYSKTVRPGDVTNFPVAYFNVNSLAPYNDTATSIRLGSWTGTRNAGHCVWAS